jgi:hypothetical protein
VGAIPCCVLPVQLLVMDCVESFAGEYLNWLFTVLVDSSHFAPTVNHNANKVHTVTEGTIVLGALRDRTWTTPSPTAPPRKFTPGMLRPDNGQRRSTRRTGDEATPHKG